MGMTNVEIAEILDPDRKRAEWWAKLCPRGHRTTLEKRRYPRFCFACGCNFKDEKCREGWDYIGPNFSSDDTAAFKHLRPVLVGMGCIVRDEDEAVIVQLRTDLATQVISDGTDGYASAIAEAFAELLAIRPDAVQSLKAVV